MFVIVRQVAVASLFVAAAASMSAQKISFVDIRRDNVFSHRGLAAEVIADFNRDGIPDVVVSAEDGAFILLGTGGGKFQSPQSVAVPELDSLLEADINGDGNPDLVGASTSGVEVLLGNGDGTFQAPVLYPAKSKPTSIALADFNGDGHLDLAVQRAFGDAVVLLLGKGDGTFTGEKPLALGFEPMRLEAGDFNGDGRADLAFLANKGGPLEIAVLFGNGDGTFQAPVIASSTVSGLVSLSVADFNGDGRDDIVSGFDAATGDILLLSGQSDGTFKTREIVADLLPSPAMVEAADVNGDGKPDIIAAYGGSSDEGHAFGVLLNNADGTFRQVPGPATTGGIQAIAVSDVTGDGNPDILDLESGGFLTLIPGLGGGAFLNSPTLPVVSIGITDVLAADFNGDGKADLVTANPKTGVIAIRLSTGGGFSAPVEFPSCSGCTDIVSGDFNGDGKLDIATGNYSGVVVLPGNGDGTFRSPIVSVPNEPEVPLIAADFNGDGILDLAWEGGTSGETLLGKGDGTFTGGQSLIGADYLAVGDLNGDGKPDLVGISASNMLALVWINRGANGFEEPLQFAIPMAGPAALADVNGDGFPDLLVWGGSSLLVFHGNGDGTFDLPYSFGSFNGQARALTLASLSASGTLDVIVPSLTSNILAVLPGVGNGTFLSPVLFPVGDSPQRAVAADFQGAGKKDIVTVDSGSGELTLLRNTSE